MSILITGGTGSFGNKFVKLLLQGDRDKIIVYSRDEQKQEQMAEYFNHDERLRFFIGDVRDKDRLKLALRGVDTVVHAAALKIVPILEYNPMEALKTNILGTQNLLEAIYESNNPHPAKVIALSTDKAVSPTNLYGASKLCLEKLVLAANNIDPMFYRFSAVRYGNVACSRGSVIPKFQAAIARGELPKVTDRRMTRFWITINEAAQFVLDRLNDMRGNEVFVPKMKSFRIIDLADLMLDLKRVKGVDDLYAYEISGIRSGEKIHETIISEDEYANSAEHDNFYSICSSNSGNLTGALTSANFVMNLDDLREKLQSVGIVK